MTQISFITVVSLMIFSQFQSFELGTVSEILNSESDTHKSLCVYSHILSQTNYIVYCNFELEMCGIKIYHSMCCLFYSVL